MVECRGWSGACVCSGGLRCVGGWLLAAQAIIERVLLFSQPFRAVKASWVKAIAFIIAVVD